MNMVQASSGLYHRYKQCIQRGRGGDEMMIHRMSEISNLVQASKVYTNNKNNISQ